MTKLLPALMLLAACGPAPITDSSCCDITGLRFAADRPLDCGTVQRNVDLAIGMIVEAGFAPDGAVFADVPVAMSDVEWLEDRPGLDGHYDKWTGEVTISRSMGALAHELLHHRDATQGKGLVTWHEGWVDRGYHALASKYEDAIRAPVATVSYCAPKTANAM